MPLVYDSGSICPQHWRNNAWQKTGDTNPLPIETFIWNGSTWVPVSSSQPLPVMTIGANSGTLNPIAVTQAPKSSFQTMKTFTGTVNVPAIISDPSSAPTLAASGTGNTLAAGTYYVKYTWLNATGGESKPSPEASQAVTSGQALNVTLPSFPTGVVSANIYVSTSSGTETYQRNITTTSTSFTAPISTGGANPPSVSNVNTYVQNLYTVTTGKTFYLTDFVACNNTSNSQIQVSINASQTIGASPVFIGHALNTAPLNALNIGTEPSVASGTPVTFQVIASGTQGTTVTYFVSGYEQ